MEKTTQNLVNANKKKMKINYKVSNVHICNQNICYQTSFIFVNSLQQQIILGTPFLTQHYPFRVSDEGILTKFNNQEIKFTFLSAIKKIKKFKQSKRIK